MEVEKILKCYDKALSVKRNWEPYYKEVYDYCLPNRQNVYNSGKPLGEKENNLSLFTSLGITASNNFVSKIQELITPVGQDWIGLQKVSTKEDNQEETNAINEELSKFSIILNSMKNGSNFDSIITEFYYDLIAGTSCLLVLPGTPQEPLKFKTIPFQEYCFTEGNDGAVREVYREFNLRFEEVKDTWQDIKNFDINEEEKKERITIIEAVIYNYDTKLWDYLVIYKKEKKIILKREYKTNPFIILRWNKASGEWYGRGVGLMAINDLKTLNLIMEYSLRIYCYQLPILLAKQDVFNSNFSLEPLSINFVESTSTNEPSITQLQFNGNNDITAYNIEAMQVAIKRTMLDNTILDDGKVRTATEVAQRIQELKSTLNNMFGRIIVDFLYPIVKRIIECLQHFNYIDKSFNVDMIDGFGFKIDIKTPLARQNKINEVQEISNIIQYFMSVDPTGQTMNKYIKLDTLIPYLCRLMGMPEEFIKSQEEIQMEQQAMAEQQQMAQQQQIEDNIYMNNEINKGKENAKKY